MQQRGCVWRGERRGKEEERRVFYYQVVFSSVHPLITHRFCRHHLYLNPNPLLVTLLSLNPIIHSPFLEYVPDCKEPRLPSGFLVVHGKA